MSAEAHQPNLQKYAFKQRAWEILAKSPRVFSHRQFTTFLEGLRRSIPTPQFCEDTDTPQNQGSSARRLSQ